MSDKKLTTIEYNGYQIIPLDYNIARSELPYWSIEGFLSKTDFSDILSCCDRTDTEYVLDFSNIGLADDRLFLLLKEKRNLKQMHISSMRGNPMLLCQFEAELENGYYTAKNDWIVFDRRRKKRCEDIDVEHAMRNRAIQIVQGHAKKWKDDNKHDEYEYLLSSGVYSDYFIDLKDMYYDHDETKFVIYMLSRQIREWGGEFDYIVTTSRNGVALGGILSEIMEKEMICFNIGQMFEEIFNFSPKIESGKRYLHIYDMICLGSEIKNMNALITAQGGELVHSFGVVCMQDLKAVRENNRFSVLNRTEALVSYGDLDIKYNIRLDRTK